jgi:hypothetical protein
MIIGMSELSDAFRRMADKIDHNEGGGFGGAYVIVAPGDGKTFDLLMLDSAASPAMFWHSLQTRVQIALADIDDAERGGGMVPFRR